MGRRFVSFKYPHLATQMYDLFWRRGERQFLSDELRRFLSLVDAVAYAHGNGGPIPLIFTFGAHSLLVVFQVKGLMPLKVHVSQVNVVETLSADKLVALCQTLMEDLAQEYAASRLEGRFALRRKIRHLAGVICAIANIAVVAQWIQCSAPPRVHHLAMAVLHERLDRIAAGAKISTYTTIREMNRLYQRVRRLPATSAPAA